MYRDRCDTGCMFWCDSPRDVVRVAGPDAAGYLQSQVSQDLRPLAVGSAAWAFLLQPSGKIDVLLRVWRIADDDYVLDTDGGFGDVMVARLNRFKIRVRAEITPLFWRCIAVRGGVFEGLVAWGEGADLLGADVEPPHGVRAGTPQELTDARIAAGWPRMGEEIRPGELLPAETAVVAEAVSFTKGCYPGQELVERMDSRGAAAPRRVVVLPARAGDVAGAAVLLHGEAIGEITSVGTSQVLALLRRGFEAGARD